MGGTVSVQWSNNHRSTDHVVLLHRCKGLYGLKPLLPPCHLSTLAVSPMLQLDIHAHGSRCCRMFIICTCTYMWNTYLISYTYMFMHKDCSNHASRPLPMLSAKRHFQPSGQIHWAQAQHLAWRGGMQCCEATTGDKRGEQNIHDVSFFLRASQDQNDFCVHNVLWVHVSSFHPYTFIYKYSIGCGGIPGKDDRKPMQLQVQLGPFFHAISSCCRWLLRHTKSEVIHEKNEIHVLINHMAPGTLMGNPWCHKRGIYQSSASAASLAFFLIAFSKALRSIPLDRKQKLLSTITKISKCGVNRGQFDISCVHLLPPYVQVSCLPWASKELSCAALKLGSVRDAGISDVRYFHVYMFPFNMSMEDDW